MAVYRIVGDASSFIPTICFSLTILQPWCQESSTLVPGWDDSLSCCLGLDIATYMAFLAESSILYDAGVIRADLHLACTGGGSGRPQLCC